MLIYKRVCHVSAKTRSTKLKRDDEPSILHLSEKDHVLRGCGDCAENSGVPRQMLLHMSLVLYHLNCTWEQLLQFSCKGRSLHGVPNRDDANGSVTDGKRRQ